MLLAFLRCVQCPFEKGMVFREWHSDAAATYAATMDLKAVFDGLTDPTAPYRSGVS